MGDQRVKSKVVKGLPLALIFLAVASFAASWGGLVPEILTETWYARWIYPRVSGMFIAVAALLGTSWLDVILPGSILLVVWLLYRRNVIGTLGLISAAYLVFFWSWGINYHRVGLAEKVGFDPERVDETSIEALVRETASSLNSLYTPFPDSGSVAGRVPGEDALVADADQRVRHVVAVIDGIREDAWNSRTRVKSSLLLDPFFRASGVDGMFNPFGHEPIVTTGLLPFERPMAILHELAHVRGYPNEGDANFVALLAGVRAADPRLRYSAWLTLWMYVGGRETEDLLDPGPRADLDAAYERMRSGRIEWVDRAQSRALDSFLKANRVDDGVRSYARIVELAAGTRQEWDRFD